MTTTPSTHPVYVISVAAALVGCHPTTLRTYDRMGLVVPARTTSGLRRYSDTDLERVRAIQRLTAHGLHLSTIAKLFADIVGQQSLSNLMAPRGDSAR